MRYSSSKAPTMAAMALASSSSSAASSWWNAKDPLLTERLFQHLTPTALAKLDEGILLVTDDPSNRTTRPPSEDEDNEAAAIRTESLPSPVATTNNTLVLLSHHQHRILAKAAIRRIVYQQLDKYSSTIARSPEQVEAALKYHTLPAALQTQLWKDYGGSSPPTTWYEALERLREIASGESCNGKDDDSATASRLWRLVLEHPMTAYVPMQCQNCGHVVPDDMATSDQQECKGEDDSAIGLSEVEPYLDNDEDTVLELRGGWFRGRPRGAKILQLDCPKCQVRTRWYRSGHPQVILNPNKWGRLCGEQEDLRLALANYLGIQVRTCVPLDWDHIWSEFSAAVTVAVAPRTTQYDRTDGGNTPGSRTDTISKAYDWQVLDDSARNFAVRLDEGIGAWTGVFGIHPDPNLCQDLTNEYLQCRSGADIITTNTSKERSASKDGRADKRFSKEMPRYRTMVGEARNDRYGRTTQANTVVGYLLQRAGMTSDDITTELQCAAKDYGLTKSWRVV